MSLIAETSKSANTQSTPKLKTAPRVSQQVQKPQPRLMKQRLIRYLFCYVALLMLLTGVRFLTASHARQLSDLQEQANVLERQSARLHRDISSLESPARVRAWAVAHDMIPFSSGSFDFVKLDSLTPVKELPKPNQKVRVETQWR